MMLNSIAPIGVEVSTSPPPDSEPAILHYEP